ncbi:hypothetical protein CHUAL_001090 [Chamberlinius hualienensis]
MSRGLILLACLVLVAYLAAPSAAAAVKNNVDAPANGPRGKCTVGDTYLYDCYLCDLYYYCPYSLDPQPLYCYEGTCWDQRQSACVSDRSLCSTPCV